MKNIDVMQPARKFQKLLKNKDFKKTRDVTPQSVFQPPYRQAGHPKSGIRQAYPAPDMPAFFAP
jgi:hypothetical protein